LERSDEIKKENESLKSEFPILFSINKENYFSVPENYFNDSTFILISNSFIPQEKVNPFQIPNLYFEEMEKNVFKEIQTQSIKEKTLNTPKNYFTETENLLTTLLELESIKNQNNFTVPDSYFEDNKELIIKQNRFSKETIINKSETWSNILAIAACFCAVSLFTVFMLKNRKDEKIKLSLNHIESIKESPEEFGLDELILAEMYEEEKKSNTQLEIRNETLIDEIVQDPRFDVNTLIETE
jgi:hypothetical protein